MVSVEIPRQWKFTCDRCGAVDMSDTPDRPRHWYSIELHRDGVDTSGNVVGEVVTRKHICETCAPIVKEIIEDNFHA